MKYLRQASYVAFHPETGELLYRVEEAARELGITPHAVLTEVHRGMLKPSFRLCSRLLFTLDSIIHVKRCREVRARNRIEKLIARNKARRYK